eukprot:jgi/Antlo1/2098/348
MEQRSCNGEHEVPEDSRLEVQNVSLFQCREQLSLLSRNCKYRIRNTEMATRLQVFRVLQLFGMEGLLEQAMDIVLNHRFVSRHALDAKACLVSLYLARGNGIPLLIGDVRKIFSRDRKFFIKAYSNEFGYQRVSSEYRNNVLHRFFSYLKPLGTKSQLYEARCCLDTLVELHVATPLEILTVAAVTGLNISQCVQAAQHLHEHFSINALRCFAERAAGKKTRRPKKTNICKGITLCSIFKRIRQCGSACREK